MPAPVETASALKHLFDRTRYIAIADELTALAPDFDRARFLTLTLDGLESRELMDRMRRTAEAVAETLPGNFRERLTVLRALAPRLQHNFVSLFLSEFVARHGSDDTATSLAALRFFTPFGSSEFAIRPFLQRDLASTLAVMRQWSLDPDEHVRRLASEGSRPRLPWGARLNALIVDPSPTFPILEQLKTDPSLYVRKSVANHLNDIAKDHPDRVLALLETWDRSDPHTAWIVRHGLRTLIKAGHAPALRLIGAGQPARLANIRFSVSPRKLALGHPLVLSATLVSQAAKTQRLVIDYVVHYARARGASATKVFKWKTLDLPPRATQQLEKRQMIRDFSTRRHHPGRHRIELQINGQRLATTAFVLVIPNPGNPAR